MSWSIVDCMIEMKKTTREHLFRQLCGAFWRIFMGVTINEITMQYWLNNLENTLQGELNSDCDLSNDQIRLHLLQTHPILKTSIKYKDYNNFFIKIFLKVYRLAKTKSQLVLVSTSKQNVYFENQP